MLKYIKARCPASVYMRLSYLCLFRCQLRSQYVGRALHGWRLQARQLLLRPSLQPLAVGRPSSNVLQVPPILVLLRGWLHLLQLHPLPLSHFDLRTSRQEICPGFVPDIPRSEATAQDAPEDQLRNPQGRWSPPVQRPLQREARLHFPGAGGRDCGVLLQFGGRHQSGGGISTQWRQ